MYESRSLKTSFGALEEEQALERNFTEKRRLILGKMPVERVPVVHKFGIISHTQRLALEDRLARKSQATEPPRTFSRTRWGNQEQLCRAASNVGVSTRLGFSLLLSAQWSAPRSHIYFPYFWDANYSYLIFKVQFVFRVTWICMENSALKCSCSWLSSYLV